MLVKFFGRGKGGGASPVNYLLGAKLDRAGARVISGNPFLTKELIDATDFARRYTSGVLSFEESADVLTEQQKLEVIEKFEKTLFSGLEPDQYNVLWVEHTDKDRLELNFLIPNQELRSGKRLQPYYHGADKRRVNAFQNIINYEYKLSNPHDLAKRRTFNQFSNGSEKAPSPYNSKAKALKDIDKSEELREEINRRLNAEHELNKERDSRKDWQITSRKRLIEWLEEQDMTIDRVTKTSISISSPNPAIKRNIRLTGALFREQYFAHQLIAEQSYVETGVHEFDYELALADWQRGVEIKKQYHAERFNTLAPSPVPLDAVLDVQHDSTTTERVENAKNANIELTLPARPRLF